jgi:hypothetical protein
MATPSLNLIAELWKFIPLAADQLAADGTGSESNATTIGGRAVSSLADC